MYMCKISTRARCIFAWLAITAARWRLCSLKYRNCRTAAARRGGILLPALPSLGFYPLTFLGKAPRGKFKVVQPIQGLSRYFKPSRDRITNCHPANFAAYIHGLICAYLPSSANVLEFLSALKEWPREFKAADSSASN